MIIVISAIAIIIFSIYFISINKSTDKTNSANSTLYDDADNDAFMEYEISYEFEHTDTDYPLFDATNVSVIKYHEYKVKGKNPVTNRMKTNKVVAIHGAPEHIITQKSGLLEPYTITLNYDSWTEREPSIKQIEYAKDLNIIFPSDCSSADISALISKQLSEDFIDYANPNLLEFAADHNICFSPYNSNIASISLIIHYLTIEDRIAFGVYVIYCFITNSHVTNMDKSPQKDVFYNFIKGYPEKIDEYNELMDNLPIHYIFKNKRVDRRNKRMAQLYDAVCQYLNNSITF